MIKHFITDILYSLFVIMIILLFYIFYPRAYQVPKMQERKSIQYWILNTGSKIAYTLVPAKGEKQPFPIIFLQGGPGGVITDRNISTLTPLSENGYDIYLYDQIGSGHSDRLCNIEEYTVDRHKRDLEEIIKKIGAGKVIIIGQSWGAMLAVAYITDNPNKVEKLIVTGPGPILPIKRELANTKVPDSLSLHPQIYTNKQANKKINTHRSIFIEWWARNMGSKLISDEEMDDFQTRLNNELNKSTVCDTTLALKAEGGAGFYAQIMTVLSFNDVLDNRAKLKNCNIPVLVMKGECDNQKWGYTNEYLELFQNHKLVIIPNAGHSISIEQPERYLKIIRDFLTE